MVRVMYEKGSPLAVLWRNGVVLGRVFGKQEVDFFIYRREELRLQAVVPLVAQILKMGAV